MVERLERKNAFLAFVSLLLLLGWEPIVSTQDIPDSYHMIVATIGEPETVDPAWAYDSLSQELIFNVYETLIFNEREGVSRFVSMLATEWHISEDGLTYTFKIGEGVMWHDSAYGTLSPADVEYSLERWMVQDRPGGPTWMILEPFFEVYHLESLGNLTDPADVVLVGQTIDAAVESTEAEVIFHLSTPYAPFLSIIAQPWASILNKQWCTDHGARAPQVGCMEELSNI